MTFKLKIQLDKEKPESTLSSYALNLFGNDQYEDHSDACDLRAALLVFLYLLYSFSVLSAISSHAMGRTAKASIG